MLGGRPSAFKGDPRELGRGCRMLEDDGEAFGDEREAFAGDGRAFGDDRDAFAGLERPQSVPGGPTCPRCGRGTVPAVLMTKRSSFGSPRRRSMLVERIEVLRCTDGELLDLPLSDRRAGEVPHGFGHLVERRLGRLLRHQAPDAVPCARS